MGTRVLRWNSPAHTILESWRISRLVLNIDLIVNQPLSKRRCYMMRLILQGWASPLKTAPDFLHAVMTLGYYSNQRPAEGAGKVRPCKSVSNHKVHPAPRRRRHRECDRSEARTDGAIVIW